MYIKLINNDSIVFSFLSNTHLRKKQDKRREKPFSFIYLEINSADFSQFIANIFYIG